LSPPACSWGTLASDGWRSLRSHPHLILFPSAFIFITVLAFNFLGDGIRDIFDPRTRIPLKPLPDTAWEEASALKLSEPEHIKHDVEASTRNS
jgi:hypothetical protein